MYLRIFASNSGNWYDKNPSFEALLKHFDAAVTTPSPVSVYTADTEAEKLRTAAAFFQYNHRKKVEKLFGVCLTEDDCHRANIKGVCLTQDDCNRANITIETDTPGKTGVAGVDQRHADLNGSQEAFSKLIAGILARFWEGENRLRVFPAWQILGELAVLARLPADQIAEEARANCQRVLDKHAGMLNYLDDGSGVELRKELNHDHLKPCVVAVRSF